MIEFHPDTADHKLTWHFYTFRFILDMLKMIELHPGSARPEY